MPPRHFGNPNHQSYESYSKGYSGDGLGNVEDKSYDVVYGMQDHGIDGITGDPITEFVIMGAFYLTPLALLGVYAAKKYKNFSSFKKANDKNFVRDDWRDKHLRKIS